MAEIIDRIASDLKQALRKRESARVGVLRMLINDLKNAGIEKKGRKGFTREVASPAEYLSSEEAVQVLRSALKNRREAAEQYQLGKRPELAAKEEAEATVIQEYLPRGLDQADLEKLVREVMKEVGAESAAQMGQVIKAAMAKVAGRAEGAQVAETVRRLLG